MSILECCLAAEKEKDGKPFTVCDVETWFYVGVGMLENGDHPHQLKVNATRLYDAFHNGEDKSERGATLEELRHIPSNGGIRIIPKTKDRFVKVQDWGKTDITILDAQDAVKKIASILGLTGVNISIDDFKIDRGLESDVDIQRNRVYFRQKQTDLIESVRHELCHLLTRRPGHGTLWAYYMKKCGSTHFGR